MSPNKIIIIPEINDRDEICDHTNQTLKCLKNNGHKAYVFYKNLPPRNVFDFISDHNLYPIKILPFNRYKIFSQLNAFVTFNLIFIYLFFRYRQKPVYWIFYPSLANFIKNSFRPQKMIFDILDGFLTTPSQNKYFIKQATTISVMTKTLANYYQKEFGNFKYTLTSPASYLAVANKTPHSSIRKLSHHKNNVGYIGAINERIDFDFVEYIIKHNPQLNFIFAGPINHDASVDYKPVEILFTKISALPNTIYLSVLPKDQIPHLLKNIQVGIIPYDAKLLFNQLSFPLKAIEYLIANLPVVTTPNPELSQYPNLFTIKNTPAEFSNAIRQKIKNTGDKKFLVKASQFCLNHTWQNKINKIAI